MATPDIPERVIKRVLARVERQGDCIVSTYSRGSHGYAQIGWHADDGRRVATVCHRVVWIAAHGPIPEGMHVDHICRNRPCINLEHLQLLSHAENSAQGGPTKSAQYTVCTRGHDMAVHGRRSTTQRYCAMCRRITAAERRRAA